MATFLTTSKMDPALAARIEASVRGRKGSQKGQRTSAARARRLVALARVVFVLTAIFGVYSVIVGRRQARHALERSRTALLESVREQGASLKPEDRQSVARVEPWLMR